MPIDREGLTATADVSVDASVVRRQGTEAFASSLDTAVIPLVEERLAVSKRRVAAGVVRVATHTDLHQAVAEVDLDRYRVEVERVPMDRIVDAVPPARTEGDTTIVSVVEERFVVVKQLVLTEELHIRHVVARETVQETVPLRRQRATVERHDAAGHPIPEPE